MLWARSHQAVAVQMLVPPTEMGAAWQVGSQKWILVGRFERE